MILPVSDAQPDLNELVRRSSVLEQQGDWEQAAALAGEFAAACRASRLSVSRITALARQAWILNHNYRRAEAIAVADELLGKFGDSTDPEHQSSILSAMRTRADALKDLSRSPEAIEAYLKLRRRFEHATSADSRQQAFSALNLAAALTEAATPSKALSLYRETVASCRADTSTQMKWPLWKALQCSAQIHERLGHPDLALGRYAELIDAARDEDDELGVQCTASGYKSRARILDTTERTTDALEVLGEAAGHLSRQLHGQAALASVIERQADLLSRSGQIEEALSALDRLSDLAERDPALRREGFFALSNKTALLNQLGRSEDAASTHAHLISEYADEGLKALDDAILHSADADSFADRCSLAGALAAKAVWLADLGQRHEAIALLTQLIERFDGELGDPLAAQVRGARAAREQLRRALDED